MSKAARPFVIIGTPEDRRVTLFQEVLAGLGLPPASVIAYADLLDNRVDLNAEIPHDAIVRIDSPGKSWEINRALAMMGKDASPFPLTEQDFPSLDSAGEYVPSWAWYAGFCLCLDRLKPVEERSDLTWMQTTADIRLMFDKWECHNLFVLKGIPTPDYNDVKSAIFRTTQHAPRNFIKSRYGSSGVGMIAVQSHLSAKKWSDQVFTTLGMHNDVLINTRQIRTLMNSDWWDDRAIQTWYRYENNNYHAETWIPKATTQGGGFDLRIVMIAGRMRHIVVRVSETPITNLHLLNKRGDFDEVRSRISDRVWHEIEETCERVAALFPNSLYMGIDLLISSTWNKHYVLEVNAFGDLLPNLLHEGDDTYTAEIKEMLKW